MMEATTENLHDILIRYEGAVSVVEGDGDHSDEAIAELETARTALLDILRQAKTYLEG